LKIGLTGGRLACRPCSIIRRIFFHQDSQAGVFHCTSRFLDRVRHFASEEAKDQFMKIVRAYEDLLGVEVLTFCVMSNHFHLLVRVPHRPEVQ